MKIAFMGDVMLGRLVNDALNYYPPEYPWGNTLTILQSADFRICNLECVLSDVGSPWSVTEKIFHFRSDEKNVRVLQAANINLVSIANNHVLDYEYEALLRMLDVLDQEKILHAGAGRNIFDASKPALCQVGNQTIAFFAFTDNEPSWAAQDDLPGVYYVNPHLSNKSAQELLEKIRSAKKRSNFIIVSGHWGPNWGYPPPKEHKTLAHCMIDAGADLIFGHSAHIFRGIEVYKQRPIIYSAGDFIDDYAVDEIERNDESFIFMLEVKDSSFTLSLYPTCINHFQVNLAASQQKAIIMKMEALCRDLGTHLECFSDHAVLEI